MSYWVRLVQDGETVEVGQHIEGGMYVLGGTTEAELNVTRNYSPLYALALRGEDIPGLAETGLMWWLDGKTARETLPALKLAVERLGARPDYKGDSNLVCDYWTPTPGNAGYAASILAGWAEQHPDAVWVVSG